MGKTEWYKPSNAKARRDRARYLLTVERVKPMKTITIRGKPYKTVSAAADAFRSFGPKTYHREINRLIRLARRRREERRRYQEAVKIGYTVKEARQRRGHVRERYVLHRDDEEIARSKIRVESTLDIEEPLNIARRNAKWVDWSHPEFGEFPPEFRDLITAINEENGFKADDEYGYSIVYAHYVLDEPLDVALRKRKPDKSGLNPYTIAPLQIS